jgi:ABC-type uncharacterized transport system permease subunit
MIWAEDIKSFNVLVFHCSIEIEFKHYFTFPGLSVTSHIFFKLFLATISGNFIPLDLMPSAP